MADKTWVGGTSDDAAVDANWSPSGVPATNDKVAIPDASTTSNDCRLTAATSWGTLTIATDGILVGNGQTLTLNGGVNDGGTAADFNYTDAGQTSNVSGNLDITMRNLRSSGDRAIITAAANNIRNLKIDDFTADGGGTGKVYHFQSHLTISGNLTVEYGELNTAFSSTSYDLTVAGTTTIGPASGAADQATLTCNASDISLGAAYTSGYALDVKRGGTFNGGSGTHTSGALKVTTDSNADAKLDFTSGNHTITAEYTSENRFFELTSGTVTHSNGTIILDDAVTAEIQWTATTGDNGPYNLTLNDSGMTVSARNALNVEGNLTITAGTYTTYSAGAGADKDLTVGTNTDDGGATGHLRIKDAGELNCNSSTVIVGSVYCQIASGSSGAGFAELNLPDSSGSFTVRGPEVSNYVFRLDNQAECNHNGGTVTFSLTAENHPSIMDVTTSQGTGVNNILVTQSVRTSNGNALEFLGSDTVKGNLTLTGNGSQSCVVDTNYNGASFTIDGDVTVNNHATLCGRTTNTGNYSFGSLTIASGGPYNATSGTTTINGNPGGYPNLGINLDGTFTHNNGTLKYTGGSGGLDLKSTGNLYNFEHAPTGTTFITNNTTIENNLTMTGANFQGVNGNENLTVKGNVTINSSGQTLNFNGSSEHTFGFLTILDGTYKVQNDTGGFTKVGGIRNVGGTVSNAV